MSFELQLHCFFGRYHARQTRDSVAAIYHKEEVCVSDASMVGIDKINEKIATRER